jgi:hypothetical protein
LLVFLTTAVAASVGLVSSGIVGAGVTLHILDEGSLDDFN